MYMMSLQSLSLTAFNGITCVFIFKYISNRLMLLLQDRDIKIKILSEKIQSLESSIIKLEDNIECLENKLKSKLEDDFKNREDKLRQSSDILFNKIDQLIIGNYDVL